ncbi:MAG: tRNA (cytidine(34)-2'-O)-methyltransferase [Pseudomonadales bacterium]|nr:tRNA (cytidine(34)-2'-O)-methyltransferase [Pseudomonadales bacterium]
MHIVLHQPEIAPNTGNIIRLCANTGCKLHLIEPLGFEMDDKRLKRAGLDYHEWADVQQYVSLVSALKSIQPKNIYAFSTKGKTRYTNVRYNSEDALIFGSETRGLPSNFLASLPTAQCVYIPMQALSRSMNLSNTVAVAVFEAWRQQGFNQAG